jgi:hypothetical protein
VRNHECPAATCVPQEEPPLTVSTPSGDDDRSPRLESSPSAVLVALTRLLVDEPLYAHYLHVTRKPHPGLDEVIAAGETDWRKVVGQLAGPAPGGKSIYYQKHMTHHLLPNMGREWLGQLANCFLIRHPREVLASYAKVIETPELEDLGFVQQAEIFEWVWKATGRVPPVLDAADVLRDPRRMLAAESNRWSDDCVLSSRTAGTPIRVRAST